jgi:hypothetical protein
VLLDTQIGVAAGHRLARISRLGFAGPRREAEEIKDAVGPFLHEDLKLELSPSKTGRGAAGRPQHDHRGHRSINAAIGLKVPIEVIRTKCSPYLHHGEPI